MREYMKLEPVFLAIDNVTNDDSSWKEAHEYLIVGFHSQSRVMITSRSVSNIQDLLPDIKFCIPMPRLTVKDARELFLRSAAPLKFTFTLTDDERRIVGLCILQCLFEWEQYRFWSEPNKDELRFLLDKHVCDKRRKSYHPGALSAFGDFFRKYFSNAGMLRWSIILTRTATG